MKKTTENKTKHNPVYFAQFILNGSMPHSIQSKDRTITLHHDTEHHKKGDKITFKAKNPKDVPFSLPGVQYILTKNNIDTCKIDPRYFTIKSEAPTKEEALANLNEAIEKIKALFTDNQIVNVVRSCDNNQKKKEEKKKKPSSNTDPTKAKKERKDRRKKFEAKTLEGKLPRKKKKAKKIEAVEYTVNMLNNLNDTHLTPSQLKRAKARTALIEFVNVWCDQSFDKYSDAMKFIRDHRNSKTLMAVAA